MRFLIYIVFIITIGSSATRTEMMLIEASLNLKYVNQKIAKDYLFLHHFPKEKKFEKSIINSIIEFSSNIRDMARFTGIEAKDTLEYLTYAKEKIEETVDASLKSEEKKEEHIVLLLHYSETVLNRTNEFLKISNYSFNAKEERFILIKKVEFLLETLLTHYVAYHLSINASASKFQMLATVKELDKSLKETKNYTLEKEQKEIDEIWSISRDFFQEGTIFIPHLLSLSFKRLEEITSKVNIYTNGKVYK